MDIEKIKAEIYKLYDECLERREPFHRKIDLFTVPDNLAQKVLTETSFDISSHMVCIDNFGIIHTLEQHGNPLSEARRGQIAVEKEDFVKMIDVFLSPDEIQIAGFTKRTKMPLLQFIKAMDDKKFVVKEIRTITSTKKKKVSRLVFHTMYKIKISK
ncbi:MAG: hypothetical protein IT258_09800 [Saprospiraceae bacterium]|nr:hypothetical protein [Saprospiraceae bacterium]